MQFINTFFILTISFFFISCGENTTSSPLKDVSSIAFDDTNISDIYATDTATALTATVTYTDGSTANATADLAWSSSNSAIIFASVGSIIATHNGGDVNLTIDYDNTFSDMQEVSVIELTEINITNLNEFNISNIGEAQVLAFEGRFENNTTRALSTNISWTTDTNATINEVNATHLTITVDYETSSVLLRAILFEDTTQDFNITLR